MAHKRTKTARILQLPGMRDLKQCHGHRIGSRQPGVLGVEA